MKQKPIRSPKHLAFVRMQQCLVSYKGERCCGVPVVAHHLTIIKGARGIGQKAGDDKTVCLCHSHHMNLHHIGEKLWWGQMEMNGEQEAENLAALSPDSKISQLYTIVE